jgi:photosystem II stability/assembly factor-like uncharacterized protein
MRKHGIFAAVFMLCIAAASAQTWKTIPAPVGLPTVIRGDPHRPGMVYFAHTGVIAGTSDGGESWIYKPYNDYFNLAPTDLLIDAIDSALWYMTFGAAGFMLSTDAGDSWRFSNNNLDGRNWIAYTQLMQDRTNPEIIYMVSDAKVYRSTDRGRNWRSMLDAYSGSSTDKARTLVINRHYPDSMYVFGTGSVKRWVSGDAGGTWSPDSSLIGNLTTFTLTERGELLVGGYRSTDYGKSWTRYPVLKGAVMPSMNIADFHHRCLYDYRNDIYVIATGIGLYIRKPSETEWSPTVYSWGGDGSIEYFDDLYYDTSSHTLWALNQSYILKSEDGCVTVSRIESGPWLGSVAAFSTPDPKGNIIFGSHIYSLDNGRSWQYNSYMDMMTYGAVSPLDSLFVLRGSPAGPVGYTTTGVEGLAGDSHAWTPSQALWFGFLTGNIHFNPHNPHEVFGGNVMGLWRVTDSIIVHQKNPGTSSDYIITPHERGFSYRCMTFHPNEDGIYYLCSYETDAMENVFSTFWKSTDYGGTWNALLDQFSPYYNDICVNPLDPDIIVIGSLDGILRSSDGGNSWSRFDGAPFRSTNISSVLIDPRFPSVYYCGEAVLHRNRYAEDLTLSSGGVYRSLDYGLTWEALPLDGMHNVSVRYIHYHENPRRLIVSTSAGIYEMLLPEYTTGAAPVPEVAALQVSVYPNPAVAGDMHTLRIDGAGGRHAVVDLYCIHGRRVARVHDGTLESAATLRHSTAGLPSGMYYYRILTGDEQRSLPLAIRR